MQNPLSQQELITCSTIREYHECLFSGQVKRVSIVSDKLLQVEMKRDQNIDGENREKENSRSSLGGKNPIVGAFVMAAAHDLMYVRYLSKLNYDQLLYTDTDSVIVYPNLNQPNYVQFLTSDLLGELKDEYEELLASNPSWYLSELIAFGPQMYQLIFKDKLNGRVVKWEKTMKGISLKRNLDMLALSKAYLY